MASDGDRHQLGDTFTRALREKAAPSLMDEAPAGELTDEELRRELTNVDTIVREAMARGVQPGTLALAERKRRELSAEYERRGWSGPRPV